jgi:inhibitor of KinA
MLVFQPLGDQAVLVRCPNEPEAFRFSATVRAAATFWLVDVVQAYTTIAVFFSLGDVTFEEVSTFLRGLEQREIEAVEGRLHEVPCCYEMQLDLKRVAEHLGLSEEEVIRLHTSTIYTVYAIGFCPGFPYLGYLPAELSGVPRLPSPRLRVEAGSVGLTGRQTGIYTEERPGGWNIIGRTPLEMVNVAEGYFPLRTGDRVRFVRIDEKEFQRLRSASRCSTPTPRAASNNIQPMS